MEKDTAKLLVIVAFLAFAVYRIIDRRNQAGRPPMVKYTIPWLGSAIEYGKDPDGLFERATTELGPIFRILAAGREIIYVTGPELISTVYRDPKTFEFLPIRLEMSEKVFGASKEMCTDPVYTVDFNELHREQLSGENNTNLLRRYGTCAYESIQNALNSICSKNENSTRLTSFITPVAYESTLHTFFGKAFSASESYEVFRTFDDGFLLLHTKLPQFLLKKTLDARSKLTELAENYITNSHEDCSEFVRAIEELSRRANWSSRDMAVNIVCDLWAMHSSATQAAFWIIALQLQRPEGLVNLIHEIDNERKKWVKDNIDIKDETDCQWIREGSFPLLTSTIQETLRYTTFSFSLRLISQNTTLGGYIIQKGENLVCSTRSTHMDDDIHPNSAEFIPDRYITTTKFTKDNKRIVPNHSMPFGGGASMCEGRHFLQGKLKIFVALLLTLVNIEPDPSSSERPQFNWSHVGTGVMPPKGDFFVRITRRTKSKEDNPPST